MSIAGGTVAPAVTFDVGVGRRDAAVSVAVGGLAVGSHDMTVGPANATWRRLGGLVDLRSAVSWPAFSLEVHASAAFTALSVSGGSLPVTSGATLFDPGALVGARGGFRLAHLAPWVEATAALWPRAHSLYVNGGDDSREVPSFEVLLGAGVSFGASR
jgi:hypothetical protein